MSNRIFVETKQLTIKLKTMTTTINSTLLGNIDFKFESEKNYHIRNGFATTKDDLWWTNSTFIDYVYFGDVVLLEFEHNGIRFLIDSGLMYSYTKENTGRCYQFIPSGNK